ncbi:hypothetical protein LEN26_007543 [Aphanomyces euteiches]|nr:hypothetical protein AeMF1_003711 [Aphanomyces euteiches]KAH9131960.1 hypothetical protein LEN26_007543 [Aphanomyces euteiches]KAH9194331.1 hypothetical protein AeNC1_003687 [Aphanomyces euteiches]
MKTNFIAVTMALAAVGTGAESTSDCFTRIKSTLNANSSLVAERTTCFKAALNTTSEAYFASAQTESDIVILATTANCTQWFADLTVAYRAISPPCTVENPSGVFRYAVTGSSANFNLTFVEYLKNMQKTKDAPKSSATSLAATASVILLSLVPLIL